MNNKKLFTCTHHQGTSARGKVIRILRTVQVSEDAARKHFTKLFVCTHPATFLVIQGGQLKVGKPFGSDLTYPSYDEDEDEDEDEDDWEDDEDEYFDDEEEDYDDEDEWDEDEEGSMLGGSY